MRKAVKTFFVLLAVFAAFPACATDTEVIDPLVNLTEDKIDIGITALTLAKEVYPDLDIEAYSAKIDELVSKARVAVKGKTDPDYRIRTLNTYLYKVEKIRYDFSDPFAVKPDNRYLNGILDTKKGSCVTLPLLYLAVASRLGYPVYPVVAPQHMFLRYVDPGLEMQNIEATSGGGYSPDEKYKEDFQIPDKTIENGVYLRTMTYRELLGELIAQNGIWWARKGDILKAARYLEEAAKLNPKGAEIYDNLGRSYLYLSRTTDNVSASTYMAKAEAAFRKAEELGIVRLSNENNAEYLEKIEKKKTKRKTQVNDVRAK